MAESSPFKQAMLSPEECYIVDNGVDHNIFVWKGADSIIDLITQYEIINFLTQLCKNHV